MAKKERQEILKLTTPEGGTMSAPSVFTSQLQIDTGSAEENALREICNTAEMLARISLTAVIDITANGGNIFLSVTTCVLPENWAFVASCIIMLREQVKRCTPDGTQKNFAYTAHKVQSVSSPATAEIDGQDKHPVSQAAASHAP